MTDELLDRELAALLSVEPSPDFVARVRIHVASRSRTHVSWLSLRVAAAAALIVAVGTVIALRSAQSRNVDATRARAADQETDVPAHAQARTDPEVLVSPSESRVVQRLLIAARGTAVVPGTAPSGAPAALVPPMPIAIAPITLEPLAAAADLESGVAQ